MSSGKPARDTSIRPPRTLPERRGGCDIAELARKRSQVVSDQPVFDVDEVKDVVGEEDNDEINAPEEEEAEQVQRLPTPDAPTLSEILDHRATHVPFRALCPDCVEGRGGEVRHFSCQPSGGRGIPTVSFDYCFIDDKGKLSC